MTHNYIGDGGGHLVALRDVRFDGNGDAELKMHVRYSSGAPKDPIGIDLKCHDCFITLTCYFSSMREFEDAIIMIFETMRAKGNLPVQLTLHDLDGSVVYDGASVMPNTWAMNTDANKGGKRMVEAKINLAMAACFSL